MFSLKVARAADEGSDGSLSEFAQLSSEGIGEGNGAGGEDEDAGGGLADPYLGAADEAGGLNTPRPHKSQTLVRAVSALGGTLERVCITGQVGGTYYATITFKSGSGARGVRTAIDARPSDAIAFAIAAGAPVYASKDLLQETTLGEAMRESAIDGLLAPEDGEDAEGGDDLGSEQSGRSAAPDGAAEGAGSASEGGGADRAEGAVRGRAAKGDAPPGGQPSPPEEEERQRKRKAMEQAVTIEMARASSLAA